MPSPPSNLDYVIRPATPADAQALHSLLRASFPNPPTHLLTTPNPALLSSGTFYLVEHATQLIACGGWTFQNPAHTTAAQPTAQQTPTKTTAHLRHFATHPAWTRRGIATAILEHCVKEAVGLGVTQFWVAALPAAVPFYKRLGFVERRDGCVVVGGVDVQVVDMVKDVGVGGGV